jgi:hypothetical protein
MQEQRSVVRHPDKACESWSLDPWLPGFVKGYASLFGASRG